MSMSTVGTAASSRKPAAPRVGPVASPEDTHGLGYERVDDDPNVDVLLSTMDATGAWEATRHLRDRERQQLRLQPAMRLLDVGCGLGDAALALAGGGDHALGVDGEVVGIDVSSEMVSAARSRAAAARPGLRCRSRFVVGDALALDEPDRSFDVVRSERTLQWVARPGDAVAEMARVLRPGGLLSLIDTDWSTFELSVGDDDLSRRVRAALRTERNRPSNVGRRLGPLAVAAGLDVVARTSATERWTSWSPDDSPAPAGCFSMSSLADDLVDAGQLEPGGQARFVATVHDAAREGRFSMALTMFAVVARREEGGS
jgi:SAM-dependent methyltransferase